MKRLYVLLTLLALSMVAVSCASAAALTKDEAKDTVLEHAGVDSASAQRMRIEYDVDGKAKKYEVEFYVDGAEYEYEINADTGEVLKAEKNDINLLAQEPTNAPTEVPTNPPTDTPTNVPTNASTNEPTNPPAEAPANPPTDTPTEAPTDPAEYIGIEAAKAVALKDACVSEADLRDLDIDLDRERGRVVYEVDFDVERREYSYEIDALTGEIVSRRTELD